MGNTGLNIQLEIWAEGWQKGVIVDDLRKAKKYEKGL